LGAPFWGSQCAKRKPSERLESEPWFLKKKSTVVWGGGATRKKEFLIEKSTSTLRAEWKARSRERNLLPGRRRSNLEKDVPSFLRRGGEGSCRGEVQLLEGDASPKEKRLFAMKRKGRVRGKAVPVSWGRFTKNTARKEGGALPSQQKKITSRRGALRPLLRRKKRKTERNSSGKRKHLSKKKKKRKERGFGLFVGGRWKKETADERGEKRKAQCLEKRGRSSFSGGRGKKKNNSSKKFPFDLGV